MKYQHFLCSQNPSSWNTHKNQWNINTFCVPYFLDYRQSCLLIRKQQKTTEISICPLFPDPDLPGLPGYWLSLQSYTGHNLQKLDRSE